MFRLLAVVATMLIAVPVGRADARSDAAALARQARRLQTEGRLALAAELAEEAVRLQPTEPGHLLLAGDLAFDRGLCDAALGFYGRWRERPAAARAPDRPRVDERTATCERVRKTRLALETDVAAQCTVDAGAALELAPGARTLVPVAPGSHAIACIAADGTQATASANPAAGEEIHVVLSLAKTTPPAAIESSTPITTPTPVADPTPPPSAGATPETKSADAEPFALPPVPDPETPAAPPIAETPAGPGLVLVHADGPGWTCRLDEGPPWVPNLAGEITFEAEPGTHRLDCTHAVSAPFAEELTVAANARIERTLTRRRPTATPVLPSGQQTPPTTTPPAPIAPVAPKPVVPTPAPAAPSLPTDMDWFVGGGFGPAAGGFGLVAGGRLGMFELALGSGLLPFAVSGSFVPGAGASGPFLSAGYVRIDRGLFLGGARTAGHAGFVLAGVDVRAIPHLRVRIGAGAAASSTGEGLGPVLVEVSAFFVP